MRARKICSHPQCFELSPCEDHSRKAWVKTGEQPDRLRGPKAVARRRYILDRDEHTCHICQQIRLAEDLVADHVIPLAEGGPDTTDNLKACCLDCHKIKSQGEAAKGRQHAT